MTMFDPNTPSDPNLLQNNGRTLMASSSLSASTAISVTNFNARGILASMTITSAFPGSASTTYALKVKATLQSGATIVLGAATPRSASGTSTLMIYPGIAASAGPNAQVNLAIPRDISVVASLSTGATSKEVIMSLGCFLLL